MARLPRLVVAGHAHHVIQRGHSGRAVFVDAHDRNAYLGALRDAAAAEQVRLHAWALLQSEVQLLATPALAPALARLVQAVGRRYVSAYNRRHGCSGTLWDGRFRCAVVEPGSSLLAVMQLIDGLPAAEPGWTTAEQRLGGGRDPALVDPPELWRLGNTPFEREAAYRRLLAQGLPADQAAALRASAIGGWAIGSPAFALDVAERASRPARPRAPGRPRAAPVLRP